MGRYPEAGDRDSTVVDLESYRRKHKVVPHDTDTDADQKPRDAGEEGAGARNSPVEGNRQD